MTSRLRKVADAPYTYTRLKIRRQRTWPTYLDSSTELKGEAVEVAAGEVPSRVQREVVLVAALAAGWERQG